MSNVLTRSSIPAHSSAVVIPLPTACAEPPPNPRRRGPTGGHGTISLSRYRRERNLRQLQAPLEPGCPGELVPTEMFQEELALAMLVTARDLIADARRRLGLAPLPPLPLPGEGA